jgi:hypothetical protein
VQGSSQLLTELLVYYADDLDYKVYSRGNLRSYSVPRETSPVTGCHLFMFCRVRRSSFVVIHMFIEPDLQSVRFAPYEHPRHFHS